jgi:hypothetical protein
MFNINGVAETVTVTGTLASKENEIKGLTIQDVSISLGRGLRNIITQLSGAAYAVVSLVGRKIWSGDSDEYTVGAASLSGPLSLEASVELTPVPNQTGTSLEWQYGTLANIPGGAQGPAALAIKEMIDPTPPKYSLDGLLSALARNLPDGYAPYIIFDQGAKSVKVAFAPTASQEAIDDAFDAISGQDKPANSAVVALEAVDQPVGNSSLPFEGGTV